MNNQPATPEEQKKGMIVLAIWIVLLLAITIYLLISQPAPVQWIINVVADQEGMYSGRVVSGIDFILVAVITYPLALLVSRLLFRKNDVVEIE